jgi:N-acetylglucosamine kinase-like BadF-type ATPase
MPFFLGIDAGATKTQALIADEHGHIVGNGMAGSGNWESVGLEGAYTALAQATAAALTQAGLQAADLSAAGYTLAGLDWPSDEGRLNPIVQRLGIPGPYTLVNDTYAALRAGSRDGCGVAVIVGTGSTMVGRNRRGEGFRTFGLGYVWGDFQGGSGLVWEATRAIGHAYFGRGPQTALTERFLREYGMSDVIELVEYFSRTLQAGPPGRLAPLVFEVAEQGDPVARAIIRAAGDDIGRTAAAVARRLDLATESFDLVLAGGVFRSGSVLLVEAIFAPVREYAPLMRPVVLQAPPGIGSVLLAMDAFGLPPDPTVGERLAREARSGAP